MRQSLDDSDKRQSLDEVEKDYQDFLARCIEKGFTTQALTDTGTEKVLTTVEVAKLFGKTKEWVYYGLTPNWRGVQPFSLRNGTPIEPVRVGPRRHRRFTLAMVRQIALSCHRRGTLDHEQLEECMAKILIAEFGRDAFSA